MKKRIICLLLALCLTVSALAGCASEPEKIDSRNCSHKQHDPETTRCLACNTRVDHHYPDDTCTLCGKKTEFIWNSIKSTDMMEVLKSRSYAQSGTIERMTYETFAYHLQALTGEEKTVEKEAYVYLPYGYDPAKQYNVLILLHGSSDDAGYWFAQGSYSPEDSTYVSTGNYTKELLDYMIGEGLCEECIVVTPSLYNDHEHYEDEDDMLTTLFGQEILEYLLPAVIQNYSTYASTMEEVPENREHFAYAGFSMGSMTGFGSIFSYCLPYFAYIGSFSGPATDVDAVIAAVNGEYKDYDIGYWYCAIGDQDRTRGNFYEDVHKTYKKMVGSIDRLVDGENCSMVDVYRGNHTYESALTSLYNALLKFFR